MNPQPGEAIVLTRWTGNQPPGRYERTVEVVEVDRHLPVHIGDTVRTVGSYGARAGVVTERDRHGAVWTLGADGASTHAWREGVVEVVDCPHEDPEPGDIWGVTVREQDGTSTRIYPHHLRHAHRPLDPTPPGPPAVGDQPDIFDLLESP